MTDRGRAPADLPRAPGPAAGPGASGWPGRLGHRLRGVRPSVRGSGLAVVVVGLLIGLAAVTVGGDASGGPGARQEPRIGSAIVQVDPDQPEPTRTEPGGRDQLLLLAALVTGSGVLVVGAATSARRARSRRPGVPTASGRRPA